MSLILSCCFCIYIAHIFPSTHDTQWVCEPVFLSFLTSFHNYLKRAFRYTMFILISYQAEQYLNTQHIIWIKPHIAVHTNDYKQWFWSSTDSKCCSTSSNITKALLSLVKCSLYVARYTTRFTNQLPPASDIWCKIPQTLMNRLNTSVTSPQKYWHKVLNMSKISASLPEDMHYWISFILQYHSESKPNKEKMLETAVQKMFSIDSAIFVSNFC